jgi:xanthine/uracil permease
MLKYRTTIGWSLITSGIVTLLLKYILPGAPVGWGVAFIVIGSAIFLIRKS